MVLVICSALYLKLNIHFNLKMRKRLNKPRKIVIAKTLCYRNHNHSRIEQVLNMFKQSQSLEARANHSHDS